MAGVKTVCKKCGKDANGPIPEGCHIHHKDGNTLNNNLDNLECLTPKQHRVRHAEQGDHSTPAVRANLDRIRPLAAPWHSSEEGGELHRRLGKEGAVMRKENPVTIECKCCGVIFNCTSPHKAIFCSRACTQRFRWRSGVDNEERCCTICGATYTTNKSSKARTCSKPCSNVASTEARKRNAKGIASDCR